MYIPKKYIITVSFVLFCIFNIAYSIANIIPFPSSLPIAESGKIIYASDINTIITAVESLEQRSLRSNPSAQRLELAFMSNGSLRSPGSEIYFTDQGSLEVGGRVSSKSMQANILSFVPYASVAHLPAVGDIGSIAYVQNKGLYMYTSAGWTVL